MILRIGVVRIGLNGFLERFTGCIVLTAIDQNGAEVIEVASGVCGVELRGLSQLSLGLRNLFGLDQRQGIVVMERGVVRLEFQRFAERREALIKRGLCISAGLLRGGLRIRVGELRPDYTLLGIRFSGFVERLDGRIPLFALHGLHARIKCIIQGLILGHRLFFERGLLLRGHSALLLLRQRPGFGGFGQRLGSLHTLLHVEVNCGRFAQLGADVIHVIDILAIDFESELVLAQGQARMKIMPLLIGLDLVVSFDICAIDLDQRAFQGLAGLVFDVPFD